jgi:hypothetical protein
MTLSTAAAQADRSAADWSFRAEGVTKVYGGSLRERAMTAWVVGTAEITRRETTCFPRTPS